jgi:hypothetical protein
MNPLVLNSPLLFTVGRIHQLIPFSGQDCLYLFQHNINAIMACKFSMCKTVGCYLFLLTAGVIYLATLKFLILKMPVPVSNPLPGLRQVYRKRRK